MGTDVKVAWRGIVRSPGYSSAVVLTLGLGIGAVALVFSLVDAFLLRTLPYPEPDRLVALWSETNWSRDMVARARADLSSLDSSTIAMMAQHSTKYPPGINDVKVAFVAGRGLEFGLSRMFAAFSEEASTKISVFYSLSDAEYWLTE